MEQTQSQQHNDDVIIIIVAICYTLFTLLTQFILELWLSFKNNSSSPKSLVTNPSPRTKACNNTQPTLTTKTLPRDPSPAQETSTRTRRVSSVATGFQPVATTLPKTKTNSLAGTTYPASRTSKNGRSTQAAPLLQEMM